jgi:hypothetical protein
MKGDNPRMPDGQIVAQYGSYTIDEAGKKINAKIEGASFSPRVNQDTSWSVEGSGDKLVLVGASRKDNLGTFSPRLEVIPSPIDQNPCAHWRNPMDMILQG